MWNCLRQDAMHGTSLTRELKTAVFFKNSLTDFFAFFLSPFFFLSNDYIISERAPFSANQGNKHFLEIVTASKLTYLFALLCRLKKKKNK